MNYIRDQNLSLPNPKDFKLIEMYLSLDNDMQQKATQFECAVFSRSRLASETFGELATLLAMEAAVWTQQDLWLLWISMGF